MRKMLTACTILMGCALSQTAFAERNATVNWTSIPKDASPSRNFINYSRTDEATPRTWERNALKPLNITTPETVIFEYKGDNVTNKSYCSTTFKFDEPGTYNLDVKGDKVEACEIVIEKEKK